MIPIRICNTLTYLRICVLQNFEVGPIHQSVRNTYAVEILRRYAREAKRLVQIKIQYKIFSFKIGETIQFYIVLNLLQRKNPSESRSRISVIPGYGMPERPDLEENTVLK